MRIFRLVERILERLHPMHPLRRDGILRYELLPLPARALPLSGQKPIRHKELVIGLHFDSRAIAVLSDATSTTQALTWRLAREAVKDLQVLADLVQAEAFPRQVRAVWAESVLYRAFARYGFTTRPARRNVRTPFARLFLLMLMAMYGRMSPEHLGQDYQLHLDLGEAWMGLDELQRRFSRPPKRSRVESSATLPPGAGE